MKTSLLCAITLSLAIASPVIATPSTHLWSLRGGGTYYDKVNAVAFDADGYVIVAGVPGVDADFGGGVLPNGSVFMAKYSPNGEHVWSHTFSNGGATGSGDITALAIDNDGNIVVTGNFQGKMDFGGGPISSVDPYTSDPFLAKFSGSGAHLWSHPCGVAAGSGRGVVVDGASIYLTGSYSIQHQVYAAMIEKYDAAGVLQWRQTYTAYAQPYGYSSGTSVVARGGNVVMTAEFMGYMTFPGNGYIETGCWEYPVKCADARNVVFIALDSDGNYQWHQHGKGSGQDSADDVAMDASGNVYGVGTYESLPGDDYPGFSLGGPPLPNLPNPLNRTSENLWVVKYSPTGEFVWSRGSESEEYVRGNGIALDASGNILVTGDFNGVANFGGASFEGDYRDVYLAKYAGSDGGHLWSRQFGGTDVDYCVDVDTDASGHLVIGGYFWGTTSLGGDSLVSTSRSDIFVAKYTDGTVPVLITSFEARSRTAAIDLAWDVWSDEGLDHLVLYRRDDASPRTVLIATLEPSTRSYSDTRIETGHTYHYELMVHTTDGDEIRSQVATAHVPRPLAALTQNSPNPFPASTTIEYVVGEPSIVTIGIYDSAGRLVTRLQEGRREAGSHRVEWNGRDANGRTAGSGVYFYRLEGAKGIAARKMVLLK